jgi:hypothetical protein
MVDSPDLEQETLRAFIDAEKACPAPAADVEQRVFARLAASVGLPLPDGPSPDVTPAVGEPSLRTGLLRRSLGGISKRGVATFLVGAAVGAATYATVQHARNPPVPPVPVVIVAPPATAEPPSPPPLRVAPEPAPSRPVQAAPNRAREAEPLLRDARDHGLGAERKLIEMARSALARGQTDRALSTLRAHARSHPHGQLAEERDSLMVQALVARGDFAQARERAARFQKQHPGSLFGPVVEQALRSIP